MKKIYLLLLTVLCSAGMNSQTVTSSCVAADSIMKKYEKDAARLAVRNVYRLGTNYKDSVQVNSLLRKRYMDALIAVYNATALPVRDTLITVFNIHTNPSPELNEWQVVATPSLTWMQELMNNTPPTTDSLISQLFPRYNLQYVYYQGAPHDQVTFYTDTNLNLTVLANRFLSKPGVSYSAPITKFNDTRNITDSLHPNFVILRYSIGWGTCNDTCDYRKEWIVKVFTDCTVEYMGSGGDVLYSGIPAHLTANDDLILFPNPFNDHLHLALPGHAENADLRILNSCGEVLKEQQLSGAQATLDLGDLPSGLYILSLKGEGYSAVKRIVKQ